MGLDEQLYPSTNSPLAVYAEGKVLGIERELRNLTTCRRLRKHGQANTITSRAVCGAIVVTEYCTVVLIIRRLRWAVALRV